MDTISYKGYTGTISYSEEDEIFYGKLDHIGDLITFESDNARELKNAFIAAVDNYLDFCREKGIDPDKPFPGSFNVRVKPRIHRLAWQKARQMGVSLNRYVETTLEKDLGEAISPK